MFDLISIGSITKDIFIVSERGKIFKTPKDKLAPVWLGFELGEKIAVAEVVENIGGVATGLSIGTKRLGLKSAPLGPTKAAVSVIVVDQKTGERVIFYEKSSGAIDLGVLKRVKSKWLSVSSLTGNWSRQAQDILAYIKKNNAKLIIAPSTSMLRDGYKNLKKLLKKAEIIFINRNEAVEIAFNKGIRTSNARNLIKVLHKLGPKVVCLTDGTKGAYCSDGKKTYYLPIKKVRTVDVTGAGDAFASGFLGFFLKGAPVRKSLKAGIINSASVVQYIGTTKGLLIKKELLKAIK